MIDRRNDDGTAQAPPPPTEQPAAAGGNPGEAERVQEGKSGEGKGAAKVTADAPKFLDLVESLQMGVMANLGMLQKPDGTRSAVNLVEAQNIIDILGVLQEKTKGNLEETEERVLREGLYHLRMGLCRGAESDHPRPGRRILVVRKSKVVVLLIAGVAAGVVLSAGLDLSPLDARPSWAKKARRRASRRRLQPRRRLRPRPPGRGSGCFPSTSPALSKRYRRRWSTSLRPRW